MLAITTTVDIDLLWYQLPCGIHDLPAISSILLDPLMIELAVRTCLHLAAG